MDLDIAWIAYAQCSSYIKFWRFRIIKYGAKKCIKYATSDQNNVEIDNLLAVNLAKLRLDHMNQEEKVYIPKLCKEYKDIFYCESSPFLHKSCKTFIRTKNEGAIYIYIPRRQAPIQATSMPLTPNTLKISPW